MELGNLVNLYMNQDIELYDPDVVDFMAQLLVESDGIYGRITKDDVIFEGICYFDKGTNTVSVEREEGIVDIELPFEFEEVVK